MEQNDVAPPWKADHPQKDDINFTDFYWINFVCTASIVNALLTFYLAWNIPLNQMDSEH